MGIKAALLHQTVKPQQPSVVPGLNSHAALVQAKVALWHQPTAEGKPLVEAFSSSTPMIRPVSRSAPPLCLCCRWSSWRLCAHCTSWGSSAAAELADKHADVHVLAWV